MNLTESAPGAVVTGAASGIGAAVARALAATGEPVMLLDTDAAGLRAVEDHIRETSGTRTQSRVVDVRDAESVAAAFEVADREFGGLAHVVSAAGILRPGCLDEVTAVDLEEHLAVNTTGVLHCLKAASRHLGKNGAVVVVSSNAARVPRTGMLAYAASKAATSALARCAGLELAARGIRCNVVEPGSTATPMQRSLWPDPEAGARAAVQGDAASYRLGIPLGRIGDPQDVAEVVAFLLSDAARHVTLQQLYVDGGASL